MACNTSTSMSCDFDKAHLGGGQHGLEQPHGEGEPLVAVRALRVEAGGCEVDVGHHVLPAYLGG